MMRIRWIADLEPKNFLHPDLRVLRKAESASQVKYLAKNDFHLGLDNTKHAIANPSNYAWYAMAQWVQQKSGHYVHKPQTPKDLAPV